MLLGFHNESKFANLLNEVWDGGTNYYKQFIIYNLTHIFLDKERKIARKQFDIMNVV